MANDLPFLQGSKGPHESTSKLGQWIHDTLPRTFNAVDDDGSENSLDLHARSTRILRRIEHKFPGQSLKRSQQEVYQLYAESIATLVRRGRVHDESGVFVVECEPGDTTALVTRVWWDGSPGVANQLNADQFNRFLQARPVWKAGRNESLEQNTSGLTPCSACGAFLWKACHWLDTDRSTPPPSDCAALVPEARIKQS